MTQQEARDVLNQMRTEAQNALKASGTPEEHKNSFLLGFMESAFETYLSNQPVYDRINDN